MTGLGGLNKSPEGVVVGLVQLERPQVVSRADISKQAQRICDFMARTRKARPTIDLLVFPEYSLNGGSKSLDPALQCSLSGAEVEAFRSACKQERVWGCFSLMEANPSGNPYNTGIIIDADGELRLHYRKMHPLVPSEPWEPGNLGVPVCAGPNGSTLALIICHDGMFPEMARECAYKGADIMIKIGAYSAAVRHPWRITSQADAFCNLMYTASVCSRAPRGPFSAMGEAMFVNFDGTPMVSGDATPDEVVTCELRPRLVAEARRLWGAENNIYQLGHRGFVAVEGGATDCPYTYMQDLARGRYRVPWESEVAIVDGTSRGHPPPRPRAAPHGPVSTKQ